MFAIKKGRNPSTLDKTIEDLLMDLGGYGSTTEEYAQVMDHLDRLYKYKDVESKGAVSPDTLATIIANLVGIVMILGYERTHIITSKAVGFLTKIR